MKAVYETPRVSFEAFAANNAVSACRGKYDCVLGNGKWDPGEKLGQDQHDQQWDKPSINVVASSAGFSNCSINAGFADYVNGDWGEDSVGLDDPTEDNITQSSVIGVQYSGNTGAMGNNKNFMGWLYISLLNNEGKNQYSTAGWSFHKSGRLMFDKKGLNVLHAWLAPVFYSNNASY